MKKTITLLLVTLIAAYPMNARKTQYPSAPSDGTVYDCFGLRVNDTYRPLENDTSAATLDWVKAENEVTRAYLDAIPFAGQLRDRLTSLADYVKTGLPARYPDGKFYYFENDGLRNQAVLYRADNAQGENSTVVLDPNTLSSDGTVALTGVSMSPDGKYLAYTIARSGSDWTEIFVLDPLTLKLLDDHILWAKFTGIAWNGDGFSYSAYPAPEKGKEYSDANLFHNVYYHKIGTPQSDDKLVFNDPDAPLHFHQAWTDDKATVMVISVGGQGNGNGLLVKNLKNPDSEWLTVTDSQADDISVIDVIGDKIYFLTSLNAPNYRIVSASAENPAVENWTDVVPETGSVIDDVSIAADKFIVTYLKDASHHSFVYDIATGRQISEISLPGLGSVAFSSSDKSPEALFSFSSFAMPSAVYSYNVATDELNHVRSTVINGFNPDDYVTEQVFYTSKDGTRVPMFVTHRKDIVLNGKNPTLLYGYGGFNISLNPGFSPYRVLWLENGGVYASANLRGGGEYGQKWHEAGTLMQKQNVFDDFIAAAQYLIDNKYTSPDNLVIEGGSNGGLLVGAVTNQRPDLFAVAIPRVGVMDMMRYHKFTIGWNWAHDYGTADDSPEMAAYLLAYSPLHNIASGKNYPAVMVTTADHDDRVVPAHSFKYAAALQKADTGDKPKLIRIDSKAGHGAGKPISKVIDEWTDIYAFIFKNLGINPSLK